MLIHSNELEIKKSGRTIGRKRKIEETETNVNSINVNYLPSLSSSSSRTSNSSDQSQGNQSSSLSLDSLIKNALVSQNITRFTLPKKIKNACCQCSAESNLYKIRTCNHVFCRICLLTMKDQCFECKLSFLKKDVEKYYK